MSHGATVLGSDPDYVTRPEIARAVVSHPPGSVEDGITVTLDGYSSASAYEVPAGNWISSGSALPAEGTVCVVVFDHRGDAWAIIGTTEGSLSTSAWPLLPTATKTGAYSAVARDFVKADISAASFAVTLPNAPVDLSMIGAYVFNTAVTHSLQLKCSGVDTFEDGGTSMYLWNVGQTVILQYDAVHHVWHAEGIVTPAKALPATLQSYEGIDFYVPPGGDQSAANTGNAIVLDSSGNAIIAGEAFVAGKPYIVVTRILPTGKTDTAFGTSGWTLIAIPSATGMAQQGLALTSDVPQKILVSGTGIDGTTGEQAFVARLTATGALDLTFNTIGYHVWQPGGLGRAAIAFWVNQTADGHVLACGGCLPSSGTEVVFVTRFNADGSIDATYGTSGTLQFQPGSSGAASAAWGMVQDSSGRAVMPIQSQMIFSTTVAAGTGAQNTAGQNVLVVASVGGAIPSGIAAGSTLKVDSGGNLETCIVNSVAGTVLTMVSPLVHSHSVGVAVTDTYATLSVARVTAGGALDTTFNGTGYNTGLFNTGAASGLAIGLQSDGRIIVGGGGFSKVPGGLLARFNTDGTLDTSFGTAGTLLPQFLGAVNGLDIDSSDRIVVANVDGAVKKSMIYRVMPNGQFDLGFGVNGVMPFPKGQNATLNGVRVAADGTIFGGGIGQPYARQQAVALVRASTRGVLLGDNTVIPNFTSSSASLPTAPAADGTVAQVSAVAEARQGWAIVRGDGATTDFTISHALNSTLVRPFVYADSGLGTPGSPVSFKWKPNALDSTASILVRISPALASGTLVFVEVK